MLNTQDPSSEDRKLQILTSGRINKIDPESTKPRDPLLDPSGRLYSPNHIPASTRRQYIFFSALLILYGLFGAWIGDIYVPGKRGPGAHFRGVPLWFLVGAMAAAVANMISVVVDHYDERNNETNYRKFARITQILGWSLFILGFLVDMLVFKSSSMYDAR
jgi:hypothetical protein